MDLLINGQARTFPALAPGATVAELVVALDLKGDRVAIEHNGQIVSRPSWATTLLTGGDRMEIVHFVGGGSGRPSRRPPLSCEGSWPQRNPEQTASCG